MRFAPGDQVLVVPLNRAGRVLDRSGARYRVEIGSLVTVCGEHELRAVERDGARSRARRRPSTTPDRVERERRVATLDLHGLSVEQAVDALVRRVDRALLEGVTELEVIHGRGTGRLRQAVARALEGLPVRHVRPHPTNPGVTVVTL